jgi:cytochrome c-type biogenesis protein CcmH
VAAAGVAAVVVVLGSLVLYSVIGRPGAEDLPRAERLALAQELRDARPSQAEAEAAALQAFPPPEPQAPADYLKMMEELRRVVPTRPEDLQGWSSWRCTRPAGAVCGGGAGAGAGRGAQGRGGDRRGLARAGRPHGRGGGRDGDA